MQPASQKKFKWEKKDDEQHNMQIFDIFQAWLTELQNIGKKSIRVRLGLVDKVQQYQLGKLPKLSSEIVLYKQNCQCGDSFIGQTRYSTEGRFKAQERSIGLKKTGHLALPEHWLQ